MAAERNAPRGSTAPAPAPSTQDPLQAADQAFDHGVSAHKHGDSGAALHHFVRALELDPDFVLAQEYIDTILGHRLLQAPAEPPPASKSRTQAEEDQAARNPLTRPEEVKRLQARGRKAAQDAQDYLDQLKEVTHAYIRYM
jgi:hypothetical protein